MKGQIWTYAGILLVLLLSSIALIKINATGNVKRTIASGEGKMISFVNYADLIIKTFNVSIEFISQRAAYDLGKIGGIEGPQIALWSLDYPKIKDLELELENRIKNNLPQSTIENERTLSWGDASVTVSDYDTTCGPIESSKCFLIKGNKSFSIYDKSIDSRISVVHGINALINFPYFRFLYAGRRIIEEPRYVETWGYSKKLEKLFNNEFTNPSLNISSTLTREIFDISIWEECNKRNEYYCLEPLKPGETGIGSIPYDYLKLNFRINISDQMPLIDVYAYSNAVEVPANVTVIDEDFHWNQGNVNFDGIINMTDIDLISPCVGILSIYPEWPLCSSYDLNWDNKIDGKDITIPSKRFNKTAPWYITHFSLFVLPGRVKLIANYSNEILTDDFNISVGETRRIDFNFP